MTFGKFKRILPFMAHIFSMISCTNSIKNRPWKFIHHNKYWQGKEDVIENAAFS